MKLQRAVVGSALLVGLVLTLIFGIPATAEKHLTQAWQAAVERPVGYGTPVGHLVDIPTLDASQKKQIEALAVADPRVKNLIGSTSSQPTEVVVWTDFQENLLGGVVTIELDQPVTSEGTWIGMAYDCSETTSPPYTQVPYRAEYANVTSLMIFVDLPRQQVVGIKPGRGAELQGSREVDPSVTVPANTCRD